MHQLEEEAEPMHLFIEGGGGVGKTCLGCALMETITRYYRWQIGENYECEVILTVAAAGMAAFQIKGTTADSGLHIPINQNKLSNLSYSDRNTLCKQYGDVKVVFIDEISVVGCCMFNKICQCLQEIFGWKKVFGGRHVVAIGDFYQTKPVKDTYIFKNPDSSYSALASNTWTDHFKIFTLVDIMRQHDEKEFCEVLNKLRKAQCTQANLDLFQSCIVDKNSTKYYPYIRHIYPFRNATDKHNEEIFDKAKEYKEVVESQDFLIGTHSREELTKCLMKIKTQAKHELISGLHRNLKLAISCVYVI